jgi:uncharacterized membrane protein YgcG
MIFGTATMAILLGALFLTGPGRAIAASGDTAAAPSPSPSPGPAGATLPSLPSGVSEVMKLFKGHISDDIIVSYIRNSRETFYLNADNLIALQQQGVSGPVLTAMLQRSGESQRQAPMMANAPAQVAVPSQAPVPQYDFYTAEDRQATANFNAALQARANAYNYAYVAPPTYPVYAPAVPVYEDPYYYDPFYYPWYPFGGVGVIDFGFGYGGGFGHGGYGHGGFGRGGVGGGVGGRGGGFGGVGGHGGGGGGHR